MKEAFVGYYPPTEAEFDSLWKSCFFAVDANVLLNLYRYSASVRVDLLGTLRALQDRIWLPHQAGMEFSLHRPGVIAVQLRAYEELDGVFDRAEASIRKIMDRYRHHSMLDRESLERLVRDGFGVVRAHIAGTKANHPDYARNDPILDSIDSLFDKTRVGAPYDDARMKEIFSEGKRRFEQNQPPGLRDQDRPLQRQRYGDLVIWKQLMDAAASRKQAAIFITDDLKDDWWWQDERKTYGPLPDLIQEFQSKTGQRFYMYRPGPFMRYAATQLKLTIKDSSIQEAGEFSRRARRLTTFGSEASRLALIAERVEVIYQLRSLVDAIDAKCKELIPELTQAKADLGTTPAASERYNFLADRYWTMIDQQKEASDWLLHIEMHPDVWEGSYSDDWKGRLKRLGLSLTDSTYAIPHPAFHNSAL